MSNRLWAWTLAVGLVAEPSFAAGPRPIREVDWGTFQRENAKRARSRSADIHLADGARLKAVVLEIADDALIVQPSRSTRQFKETDGKALVPRDAIESVQFSGRAGRKGMWGLLAGLGAGGALAAGVAANCGTGNCEGNSAGIGALTAVGALAVAGWFIGRAADERFPEYRIVRK